VTLGDDQGDWGADVAGGGVSTGGAAGATAGGGLRLGTVCELAAADGATALTSAPDCSAARAFASRIAARCSWRARVDESAGADPTDACSTGAGVGVTAGVGIDAAGEAGCCKAGAAVVVANNGGWRTRLTQ